jgi:hypothetical protein
MYANNGGGEEQRPTLLWMGGFQDWANSLPWPLNAVVGLLGALVGLVIGLRLRGDHLQWAGAFLGFVVGCFFIRFLVALFRIVTQLAFIAGLIWAFYVVGVWVAHLPPSNRERNSNPPARVAPVDNAAPAKVSEQL